MTSLLPVPRRPPPPNTTTTTPLQFDALVLMWPGESRENEREKWEQIEMKIRKLTRHTRTNGNTRMLLKTNKSGTAHSTLFLALKRVLTEEE